MANFARVVLVTRQTRLEELKVQHAGSVEAAEFAIISTGQDLIPYRVEQKGWETVLSAIRRAIPRTIQMVTIQKDELPRFIFDPRDLVIAVGPDGLFVNIAKYVHGQPILPFNPSPATIDGVLMRFTIEQVSIAIDAMFRNAFKIEEITLCEAYMVGQQPILGVNEIVVGRCDPQAAYYTLRYRNREEHQCSTRLLVATGCGSTGWARSIITGAQTLVANGKASLRVPFARTDKRLIYVACEPFVSRTTAANLASGLLEDGEELTIVSDMAQGGAIYSDGMWRDARDFPTGSTVTIRRSSKTAHRVVDIKQ